ncbi:MAG TPA: hypothetical protein VMC48_04405 [Methanobacterium sp.]|nr:hypothetical protein [Methanobacterium sp.]
MAKSLDILMAGIIAGIVAYTTSKLGIGGTVIGAVLGSMLYQLMSHFIKDPVENVKTEKVEREIFYVFPLIIILAIEVTYLLAQIYNRPEQIIFTLESATGDNLFKFIGAGLIIMGLYPILQPDRINKIYGCILLVVGVIELLVGFADVNNPLVQLYAPIYYQINEVISLAIITAITYVVVAITRESVQVYYKEDEEKDISLKDPKDK